MRETEATSSTRNRQANQRVEMGMAIESVQGAKESDTNAVEDICSFVGVERDRATCPAVDGDTLDLFVGPRNNRTDRNALNTAVNNDLFVGDNSHSDRHAAMDGDAAEVVYSFVGRENVSNAIDGDVVAMNDSIVGREGTVYANDFVQGDGVGDDLFVGEDHVYTREVSPNNDRNPCTDGLRYRSDNERSVYELLVVLHF